MKRILAILGVALGTGFVASPALGDAWLQFKGAEGSNATAYLDKDGVGGYELSQATVAGRYKWVAYQAGTEESSFIKNGDTIFTFCAEIGELISNDQKVVYGDTLNPFQMPVNDNGWLNGTITKQVTVNMLTDLYETHFLGAADPWNLGALSSSDKIEAAAFQMASWEVMYECEVGSASGPGGLNVTSGQFMVAGDSSAMTMANTWLAALNADHQSDGKLLGFFKLGDQDQWFYPIPLPAPVYLAGVGLLGIFAGRKRFAKLVR